MRPLLPLAGRSAMLADDEREYQEKVAANTML
jgi:hypothetical protein